jgi:hypothetical protein
MRKGLELAGALVLALSLHATAADTEAKVCADPAKPCPGFRDHDLSFALPADGKAHGEIRSAPFYAVILETSGRCKLVEARRRELQALFTRDKVFSTSFACGAEGEDNVTYTGVDDPRGVLAVYAGEDQAAADAQLARVQRVGFPGASVRRMQVVYVAR